jgi:hypothetical protein
MRVLPPKAGLLPVYQWLRLKSIWTLASGKGGVVSVLAVFMVVALMILI